MNLRIALLIILVCTIGTTSIFREQLDSDIVGMLNAGAIFLFVILFLISTKSVLENRSMRLGALELGKKVLVYGLVLTIVFSVVMMGVFSIVS